MIEEKKLNLSLKTSNVFLTNKKKKKKKKKKLGKLGLIN